MFTESAAITSFGFSQREGLTRRSSFIACSYRMDFQRWGGEFAIVDEDVEVTGYFFKRWAYGAQKGGMRLAPLILAKIPEWTPSQRLSKTNVPSPAILWSGIAAMALIAIAIAIAVYWVSRWKTGTVYAADPEELQWLAETDGIQTLGEKLQQLANDPHETQP